jgi:hypothetical protein
MVLLPGKNDIHELFCDGLKRTTNHEKISYVLHEKDDFKNPFSSTRHPDITCRYRQIWPGKITRT